MNDIVEINTVKIRILHLPPITLVAIYRPPVSENIPEFIVTLNEILAALHSSMPVYVVGDINIDILQEGGVQSDFVEMMRTQSLVPLVTIPTRVTESSATLLDHIWSNQLHESNTGVLNLSITDHYLVFFINPISCWAK